jgi:Fatty-acid desaturase
MWASFAQNFPEIKGVRWFNVSVLVITPAIAGYGLLFLPLRSDTMFFAMAYYVFSMLGKIHTSLRFYPQPNYILAGITAGMTYFRSGKERVIITFCLGYHRFWSHRSYNASVPLQCFLLFGGTSAVQGSCYWWARAPRSHHRHTDTDLDPYNAKRGLLWTHVGWMLFKSGLHSGGTDVSDLRKDRFVQWQHRWYTFLLLFFGWVLPTIIPGLLWGDWKGGFVFAGNLRLTVAHHVS